MNTLPPCPIEGCTSDSDHHWHWRNGSEWLEVECATLDCDYAGDYVTRCYSRALPKQVPMLSLPTVAALVEAARAEGWERGYQAAHDFDTFFEWVG